MNEPIARVQTARLSVIVTSLCWPPLAMVPGMGAAAAGSGGITNRGRVERSIEALLTQLDPIGTEIVLVDEGVPDGTTEHIESIFGTALSTGKLKIARMGKDRGDRGAARNQGAELASGVYLAFLDPEDRWLPGRLERLAPWLSRHDLILSAAENPRLGQDSGVLETDWLRAFMSHNWALPSSLVVQRTLFEKIGGFRVGYQRFPLPSRIPGKLDYELWLRALLELSESGRRNRFALLGHGQSDIELSPEKLATESGLMRKLGALKEAVTLLALARKLPWKNWPEILGQVKNRIL